MSARSILAITGSDREKFLQGLITNDVAKARGGIIYAALLTPQGKYLADFFVIGQPDRLLVDVAEPLAGMLAQRLSMYRLRADVQVAMTDLQVRRGTGPAPASSLADPRHPSLGWRLYGSENDDDGSDWDALRVAAAVPETGIELSQDSYILECGFERLHGVDFRKGCYVGQEVTARMKHKTELRKGLAKVSLSEQVLPGTPVLDAEGRNVGTVHTVSGTNAIAFLRFDRVEGALFADGATVSLV